MNHEVLCSCLRAQGIIFELQHGFSELVPGIDSDVRIVCAEEERDNGFHGISFWLYGDDAAWFIGLWSGIYFRIDDPTSVVNLVRELLSGEIVAAGKAPGDLPDEFVRKHRLAIQLDQGR